MALKKKLTKAEFDALPSAFQAEYKAVGENFMLDIEGDDGIDWKAKREIEADHRKKAEKKVETVQEELDNVRRGAIPKDDVEALETSWKTKVTDTENRYKGELAERDNTINNLTVNTTAKDVASMFLAPSAMIPMIRSRLKTEITNGVAVTRVLDKNGQPSALTVEDLKNEFKADPELAPVIVGSKGSGGGGGGKEGGGGADKKLSEMNDQERIALAKADPAKFKQMVEAQKQAK